MLKYTKVNFEYTKNAKTIKNISYEYKKGSMTAIIGENGSGKTTMLNIMTMKKKEYEGEISYEGQDVSEMQKRDLAKQISFAPQKITFPSGTTVKEIVALGRFPYTNILGRLTTKDLKVMKRYSKTLKVQDLWDKQFSELSGGQQQRVIITMCLVQETEVIILDEPTNHIDIKYQVEVLRLLKDLNENHGKTIIACIHDINLAARFFDEFIMLKKGAVMKTGNKKIINKKNIKELFELDVDIDIKDGNPVIVGYGD